MMRRLLFFLMMGACLSLSASNDKKKAVEVNSFVYLLDDETMTAEVTGLTSYTGVLDDQGVLEIPASVTFEGSNYSVTSIGSNAFRDKTGIKQVKMPESIITIGEAAFSECKFDAVNIPDGVQEIQRHAFSNNGWLQTVKIGKGIKTIAPNVFFMTALKTIVIEANSIPEADDTSFGDWTYDLQTRKPMLYVPGELVNSYRESNDFPWMYFEDSRIVAIRTEWKEPELPYSYGPDKVELDRLSYYLDKENKAAEVTKSKSLYYLKEMIEANGGELEIPSVINVNGEDYIVRSIGDGAFMNLLDTRSLVLPETLVSIGDDAFYNLGVDSLSIPDNVISIGQKAFKSCDNLKAVNIGKGIKAIGDEAFNGCPVMNHIYLHADAIPDVGYYAFGDNDRYKTNIKTMVLFVPEGLVNDYQQSATTPWSDFTKSYIVVFGTDPSSLAPQVISVDNCSYLLDRTNLTAELINGKNWKADVLSIPASIMVDGSAYQVTAIGGLNAKGLAPFSSCEGIKEIIIPNSVISIGSHAFSYCYDVESLTIGESVKTIGVAAFNQCNSLRTVYVLAPWIPTTTVYYSDFSHEDWYRVTLYVPDDLVDAYKESQLNYWNSVRDENIKPLGTTSITSLQTESMNGTYRPMIEDGKVWKVGSKKIKDNLVKLVGYYYFDGDTIIGGKTCKKMMFQQYVTPDYPEYDAVIRFPLLQYVGAWYEEDKKVYFCNEGSKQMDIKYDFSIEANDTLWYDTYYPCVIGPRQTGGIKGFKGVYRIVLTPQEEGPGSYNTTWLEGVGSNESPTKNVYYGYEYHLFFLMSCTVGDEVIYLNDEYEDGATPMDAEAKKHRFDFTHTIKTKPQTRGEEEEQSLYGEYNNLLLGIDLEPLDEAYLVRITNESDQVVYEKTINAGNIVGLNIDISAFAKGRYTVTMENSSEVFTGEFETITTGIQELKDSRIEGLKSIYNLQGQRLNRLQKGLNIVNRRKVFVK